MVAAVSETRSEQTESAFVRLVYNYVVHLAYHYVGGLSRAHTATTSPTFTPLEPPAELQDWIYDYQCGSCSLPLSDTLFHTRSSRPGAPSNSLSTAADPASYTYVHASHASATEQQHTTTASGQEHPVSYRYDDLEAGNWPSRDPIGERGGLNLYGFVGNDGVNGTDRFGLLPPPTDGDIDGAFAFETSGDGDWFEELVTGNRKTPHPNVRRGSTGKDLLNYLKELSQYSCCIRELRIASHGGPGGLGGAERGVSGFVDSVETTTGLRADEHNQLMRDRSGLAPNHPRLQAELRDPEYYINENAREIADLKTAIDAGEISFCKPCEIKIYACDQDRLPMALAKVTGCNVIASVGAACGPYYRNPDKRTKPLWGNGTFSTTSPDGTVSRLPGPFDPDEGYIPARLTISSTR